VIPVVRIERIAAGGDGVGRMADGRAVFVPRTAPGDEVELEDVRLHARFARAWPGRLVAPGPDRVVPRCLHYQRDRCGGCQLQHLSAAAQHAARRAIVGDALRRIGRLAVEDPSLEAPGEPWAYRHRITLHGDPTGRRIGFYRLGDGAEAFDLERCEIAAPGINRIWTAMRAVRDGLPPALDGVVLRLARDGHGHVVLRGPVRPAPDGVARLEAAMPADGPPVSWWWEPERGQARLIGGPAPVAAATATSFEQVNPAVGDAVRTFAVSLAGDLFGRHAWDLYAGIGEAGRLLRQGGATVDSVERDAAAVAVAEQAGPAEGIRRHTGPVEHWVGRLTPPAVVFTNPPRSGMEPAVVAALARAGPAVILYVSCDPATLARDIRRLGTGYRVGVVRAFDLFPQTAHVETVVRLERA
jgi:23S rRNA (uracil1939-C5)-methyltransferase